MFGLFVDYISALTSEEIRLVASDSVRLVSGQNIQRTLVGRTERNHMVSISFIGMIAEFAGALLMVLPDIPYVKSLAFPSTLEDARRELFDTSSITEGSEEFDALEELIRDNWEGELEGHPWLFLIERVPPLQMSSSVFAIHEEESEGPFGDLMTEDGLQQIPERFDGWSDYIHQNKKWDAVCAKQVLDGWVSDEVSNKNRAVLITRGVGFLLFVLGFGVQLL